MNIKSVRDDKKCFFSVIIPVYNKELYVNRAISSALNQEFDNFELLIINDASTDNSLDEIQRFVDPRIRVLHRSTPGAGGYAARNLGIKEAQGEWIAFLDADDEWMSNHLTTAHSLIFNHSNCTFVHMGYILINEKLSKNVHYHHDEKMDRLAGLKYYAKEESMNTNSVVARKTSLIDAGLFPSKNHKRGGDSDLWLRLILSSQCIVVSSKITSKYYTNNSEIIPNISNTSLMHPIIYSVKQALRVPRPFSERLALMRLANRKGFIWSLHRKKENVFDYREFLNYYIIAFSFKDWLFFLILILPKKVLHTLIKIKNFKID